MLKGSIVLLVVIVASLVAIAAALTARVNKDNEKQDKEDVSFSPWETIYAVPPESSDSFQINGWSYRVETLTGNAYIYHYYAGSNGYSFEALSPLFNRDGTPVSKQQLISLLVSQGIIK